ncbi:DUF1559 family PulG-like putative transporter [Planctomicrobium sp. SH664]|uniref:DUF1559 family PulG-like putative transporter n=1 Tax=Planctomicrobium sp. SH664 TaxID=3448125 RepID=UPI003F5C01BC
MTFADIVDGMSNTIAIWESAGRPFVYRRGTLVDGNLYEHHTNGGGWSRPASDILLYGSDKMGVTVPTTSSAATTLGLANIFINRTNGYDHAAEQYGTTGFPAPFGTEGSSQPYSFHNGGLNVLFGDGSARFLSEDTGLAVIAALVTRNGGTKDKKVSSNF